MSRGEYEIIITNQAVKQIKKSSKNIKDRVKNVLKTLREYPIPVKQYDVKKIKGEEHTYRIRIGKYRIIYEINEDTKEIIILGISHRKKAYK